MSEITDATAKTGTVLHLPLPPHRDVRVVIRMGERPYHVEREYTFVREALEGIHINQRVRFTDNGVNMEGTIVSIYPVREGV